jgi:beta-glucan synthesis-associated protein KRE6
MNHQEPDDYLHNPDPRRDRKSDKGGTIFTSRGLANLGCLALLVTGLTTLLSVPIKTPYTLHLTLLLVPDIP